MFKIGFVGSKTTFLGRANKTSRGPYRLGKRSPKSRLGFESLEARALLAAEIEVRGGNNLVINDGDTTPSPLDFSNFGQTQLEGGTIARTFTVRNLGTDPLDLSGTPLVQISGAHAADFTVVTEPAATIGPDASSTFTVRFDPSAAGARSASISLDNNDENENPYDFAISGTGASPTVIAADDSYIAVEDTLFATGATVVVPLRSSWRYFEDMTRSGATAAYPADGTTGDDWNDRSYNLNTPSFGTWKGPNVAPFAAPANGVAGLTAPVTTLNSGFIPPSGTRVTALFRTNFPLSSDQTSVPTGRIRALCDDGCAGYINGVEVFRLRMPVGPITAATQALQSTTAEESVYTPFNINFAALGVPLFADDTNIFALELHQSDPNSSDIGFDATFELNDGPAGVLANDDLSRRNGTLTIALVSQPVDSVTNEPAGTVTLAADNSGNFTFTPRLDYHGTARFSYRINDASNSPTIGVVTLDVASINDPPVAVADRFSADGGQAISAALIGAPLIEAGDSAWWYQDDGSDQDTLNPNWKAAPSANFDPAAAGWKGPRLAELGFGDGDEHTVINNASAAAGFTYYFFSTFDVVGSPEKLVLELKRDDGAAVYLNGVKVVHDNLPTPHPYNAPASSIASDDGDADQRYVIDTANLNLSPAGNTIAVEVHQQSATSSDVTFDLRLYDPAYGVLGNDEDVDDDAAVFQVVNVTHSINPTTEGTLTVAPDGTFSFTPANPDVFGTFTFTYQVQDDETPTPGTSAPGTVTLALAPPPDAMLLPDLFAWASESRGYLHGWTIDTDEIPGRTLLRLSTATPNIGAGPMELRGGAALPNGTQQEVNQRIYLAGGGTIDRLAGTFVYHPDHGHIHWENFAQYMLREVLPGGGVGNILAIGGKTSFCLLDLTVYDLSLPGAPPSGEYGGCGQLQGISVGHSDVYDQSLPDQWIDITNIPLDQYWMEVVVDPADTLLEADETNNTTRILIDLASAFPPDSLEPNDGFAEARDIGTGDVTLSNLTIHRPDNEDFYHWTSSAIGPFSVTAQFSDTAGDVNLFLYDANQNLVDSSTGATDTEQVTTNVAVGQSYYIVLRTAAGDTSPAYSLTIDSPTPVAEIHGRAYSDLDGDGVSDPGEPGLANRTIYLDINNNGQFEPQQSVTRASTNVPISITDHTTSTSNLTVSDALGAIVDVDVTLSITHTYDADLQTFLISPAGTRVELFSAVGGGSDNFAGTILDDEAIAAIDGGAAPFTGRFRPEALLSVFDGQNPTGTWRLEIRDTAGADEGALTQWSLTITAGERSVQTESDGTYQFLQLPPGTHRVRQVPVAQWDLTQPATGVYTENLAVGDSAEGRDFGSHDFLTGDLNGDRRVDRQDAALLAAAFGQSAGVTPATGDLDGDGQIGALDVALFQTHFGRSMAAPSAPAAVVTASLARTPRQRLTTSHRRDTIGPTTHDVALTELTNEAVQLTATRLPRAIATRTPLRASLPASA
jgi:subtilisin-like proprotein convertase family protein